jgi:hypothetical protein
MPTPPPLDPLEEEYYNTFKKLVREQLPDGRGLMGVLKSAYDQYFETEAIVLSRRERHRLFESIVREVMNEMAEALQQLKP